MSFPRRTDVARHLARSPRSASKVRPEAIPVERVADLDQREEADALSEQIPSKASCSAHAADKSVNQ